MGAQSKDGAAVPYHSTNALAIMLPDLDLGKVSTAEEDLARGGAVNTGLSGGGGAGES